MDESSLTFEVGPIRPPSEANSLLLRITRNCPWNQCKFCDIYKGCSFSTRSLESIEADIRAVAQCRDDLLRWGTASSDYALIKDKLAGFDDATAQSYIQVLRWLTSRERTLFLQDANTMVLKAEKLLPILVLIQKYLPEVERITSYGRVDAINRYSSSELKALRDAGLDRIHSGYETGSDKVLTLIQKGYTKTEEIEAGQKVREAGIELSVYVMPGVGGVLLSEDNARHTADVINQVNPDFVRVRTFVSKPGTGLMADIEKGLVQEPSDYHKCMEIKALLSQIKGASGSLFSDHIINLLEAVNGSLKADIPRMLQVFDAFERLPATEQKRFQLARRLALVQTPDDLPYVSQDYLDAIDRLMGEYVEPEQWEGLLLSLLRKYI